MDSILPLTLVTSVHGKEDNQFVCVCVCVCVCFCARQCVPVCSHLCSSSAALWKPRTIQSERTTGDTVPITLAPSNALLEHRRATDYLFIPTTLHSDTTPGSQRSCGPFVPCICNSTTVRVRSEGLCVERCAQDYIAVLLHVLLPMVICISPVVLNSCYRCSDRMRLPVRCCAMALPG